MKASENLPLYTSQSAQVMHHWVNAKQPCEWNRGKSCLIRTESSETMQNIVTVDYVCRANPCVPNFVQIFPQELQEKGWHNVLDISFIFQTWPINFCDEKWFKRHVYLHIDLWCDKPHQRVSTFTEERSRTGEKGRRCVMVVLKLQKVKITLMHSNNQPH